MRELQKAISEQTREHVLNKGFFALDRQWALRLTVDPSGKMLQFSVCTSDGTLAFLVIQVWANSPYSSIIVPLVANCHAGAVHYSFPIEVRLPTAQIAAAMYELQELTREDSPFVRGKGPYMRFRAEVFKVFPPSCLPVDLKGLFIYHRCSKLREMS